MKIKGFTLIELSIILIVMVGLALISFGTSSQLISKNEQQTLTDQIKSIIQYAKIQAINLGHSVSLAPLDASSGWSKGIVLTQFNKNTTKEEVLYQWQWNYHYWTVDWIGVNSTHKIILAPDTAHGISNGTFTLSNIRTSEKIKLIVNRLGRVRVEHLD
ncbi:GspH/FimT family pseudopilin [Legionella worsleiensis]|uniref:Type II secretion system protein H n=1 Tax=Legionella worsleiensis TaxID=45076 RepID=A0A0W1A7A7_9GAMM|nr:GspH/FimT family pseudopilin [Legionella worsleiensis]KTD76931.1 Tfp type 4 fimbrial pilin like signal peptide protein domain protein [Legionella worsleiensis]STY33398.1 Tfp type 4 fimbrial pilin like signal peptide protein domain protein [Legionella worsleiensis]